MKNFKIHWFILLFAFWVSLSCSNTNTPKKQIIKEIDFRGFLNRPLRELSSSLQSQVKDTFFDHNQIPIHIVFLLNDGGNVTVFVDQRQMNPLFGFQLDSMNEKDMKLLFNARILEITLNDCEYPRKQRKGTFARTVIRQDSLVFNNEAIWKGFIGKKAKAVIHEWIYNWDTYFNPPEEHYDGSFVKRDFMLTGYEYRFSKYPSVKFVIIPDLESGWGAEKNKNVRYNNFLEAPIKEIKIEGPYIMKSYY